MTTIYNLISPTGKTYTGDATYLKIEFERKDYGFLNEFPITLKEVSDILQKIHNEYGIKFLKASVSEDTPEKTWYGYKRHIIFELYGIQGSPIAYWIITGIISIIVSILVVKGLVYIRHIVRDIFYSPLGEGTGEILKEVGKNLVPLTLLVGGIVLLVKYGKREVKKL